LIKFFDNRIAKENFQYLHKKGGFVLAGSSIHLMHQHFLGKGCLALNNRLTPIGNKSKVLQKALTFENIFRESVARS